MKKYYIESEHNIYLDSYKLGELEFINSYDIKEFIFTDNPKKAIEKFIDLVLYYSIDIDEIDIEEGNFQFCILVDEDNLQATIEQIELWKNEQIKLYSNVINLKIHELNQITNL